VKVPAVLGAGQVPAAPGWLRAAGVRLRRRHLPGPLVPGALEGRHRGPARRALEVLAVELDLGAG
jgi:hypothetical protein